MALWQYSFKVLTKDSFDSLQEEFNSSKDSFDFDDEIFWQYKPIHKSIFKGLTSILKKEKAWSNQIDLYGNQESNCFEVFFNNQNDIVLSVSFRIDFRSNYEYTLSQIIEFCIFNDLIILDENFNVVFLNFESAKNIIESAPQIKRYNKLSNESPK